MVYRGGGVLLGAVLFLSLAGYVQGQEVQPTVEQEITADQVKEIEKWRKEDTKYLNWYKIWGNKAKHVKIRHRPEPPVWLADKCSEPAIQEVLVSACKLYKEIKEGPEAARIRRTILAERTQKEAPTNFRFLERIHFGGGWPIVNDIKMMKYGAIFETHISIADIGRVEINLPGIMFISYPDYNGRRGVKRATHIGMGFQLKTFKLPGYDQKFVLHFNIANAWVMDGFSQSNFFDQKPLSLAGFSLTIKK